MFHYILLSANHHAVATIKPPYAAARPYIYIVDILWYKFLGATNVVNVVRIAAVNENVVRVEVRQQVSDRLIHSRRRHHQPYCPWFSELLYQVRQRFGSGRSLLNQFLRWLRRSVE